MNRRELIKSTAALVAIPAVAFSREPLAVSAAWIHQWFDCDHQFGTGVIVQSPDGSTRRMQAKTAVWRYDECVTEPFIVNMKEHHKEILRLWIRKKFGTDVAIVE